MSNPIVPLLQELEEFTEIEIGWDALPTLLPITGSVSKASMPGVIVLAGDQRPVEMLAMVEPLVIQIKHELLNDQHLLGLALVTEGWAYPQKLLDEMAAKAKEWVEEHRAEQPPELDDEAALHFILNSLMDHLHATMPPSKCPDRREIRQITALLRDGQIWLITRFRGEAPEVHDMNQAGAALEGRIPDSLRVLLQAVLDDEVGT